MIANTGQNILSMNDSDIRHHNLNAEREIAHKEFKQRISLIAVAK